MTDWGLGFRASWQDFRGWRTRDVREPMPPVRFRDFPSRADAELECRLQRAAGMTACVAPVPPPARHGRLPRLLPGPWPVQHDPAKDRPGFGT